ncbi:MAG: transporter substrate-binding domain-containing protein [Actinobacteria bacterium]|nr:MAG: transporter substrate-binding domain-containing protein [Actinomycetota bacterium]
MRKGFVATVAVACAALAVAAVGSGSGTKAATTGYVAKGKVPIKLAFSTWNGYMALVIAAKEGYYKKHGLKVSYTVIEDPVQRFNAFKAGSLNAIATTVDTYSRTYAKGIHSVEVLGLDASVGGDGIVAEKSITTVGQLKGQKIAVSAGSTSQWLLAYVLSQHHLSLKDVQQIDLTSGDAGAAFAAGRVKVAVTWQPWLSRAEQNPNGHVLVSTKQYPTIITDHVAFAPSFVRQHPGEVKAFIAAYTDAMSLIKKNPSKAFADVHDYLGQSAAEIKATMKDVPLWPLSQSKKYYGTRTHPGAIYKIFKKSANFWKSIGEIKTIPSPKNAIDPTFVNSFK